MVRCAWLALVSVLTACAAASHAGCSSASCEGRAIVFPIIRVHDAMTGQPICDATVVALTGDASSAPLPVAMTTDGGGCTYGWNVSSFAGTFELRVSKPGYAATVVPNVQVQAESCSGSQVNPQVVEVSLAPGA